MESTAHIRIRRARLAQGLSLDELACRLGDITKQGLSKFESGALAPNSTRLIQLAKVLGVKPEYFLRKDTLALAPLEFRKLAKMPAYRQDQVRELMRDHLERYVSLERSLDIDVSDKLLPRHSISVATPEHAEQAALQVRGQWGIGSDAIANLTDLLENYGFKVVLLDVSEDFDGACASTIDDKNVLLALNGDRPGDRMRFTAAHELGHWVMAFPDAMAEKDRERCCHRFAAAFLFPADQVHLEFGDQRRQRVHFQEILNAKQSYGVSMNMIIFRLKDLGLIGQSDYQKLFIDFSQRGWRKKEPDALPPERPRRFESLVYRGLAEEVFTLSRAAELLQIPLAQLNADVLRTASRE